MILLTDLNKQLSTLSVEDLNITKDYISDLIKVKVKSSLKVGSEVYIVQKTIKQHLVLLKK